MQGAAILAYQADGSVASVQFDPGLADSTLEECLSNVLLEAKIRAYDGGSVAVKKHFSFER